MINNKKKCCNKNRNAVNNAEINMVQYRMTANQVKSFLPWFSKRHQMKSNVKSENERKYFLVTFSSSKRMQIFVKRFLI